MSDADRDAAAFASSCTLPTYANNSAARYRLAHIPKIQCCFSKLSMLHFDIIKSIELPSSCDICSALILFACGWRPLLISTASAPSALLLRMPLTVTAKLQRFFAPLEQNSQISPFNKTHKTFMNQHYCPARPSLAC